MDKETARAFTKRRKDNRGNVNRKLNVNLRFVVEDIDGTFSSHSTPRVAARLLEVKVFEGDGTELVSFSGQ